VGVTPTLSHCCVGSGAQRLSGFSLIECLVVNALALVLLSLLLVASADMISAAQKAADRSEQAIRARQVFDFLDSLLKTAQLPDTWTADAIASEGAAVQRNLIHPCKEFDTVLPQPRWGGYAIVELAKLSCIPGADTGVGLYVERVLPCPEECGEGAGYQIVSTQCQLRHGQATEEFQFQVSWEKNMERPHRCPEGAAWGRVERLLISHRSAEDSIEGVAVLRLQQIAQGLDATYRWSQAETIVLGIDAWQLSDLNQFSNLAGKETRLPFVRSDVLRVKVIIGPPRTEIALPSLAIDRLFISDRLPARG
jgi:hypothetical protein